MSVNLGHPVPDESRWERTGVIHQFVHQLRRAGHKIGQIAPPPSARPILWSGRVVPVEERCLALWVQAMPRQASPQALKPFVPFLRPTRSEGHATEFNGDHSQGVGGPGDHSAHASVADQHRVTCNRTGTALVDEPVQSGADVGHVLP